MYRGFSILVPPVREGTVDPKCRLEKSTAYALSPTLLSLTAFIWGVLWYPQINNNPLFSFIQRSKKIYTCVKNMTNTIHTCPSFGSAPENFLYGPGPVDAPRPNMCRGGLASLRHLSNPPSATSWLRRRLPGDAEIRCRSNPLRRPLPLSRPRRPCLSADRRSTAPSS
jgi:hypothetical protein